MAFLPGDSLLFVAGAVSALPKAQAKGLSVHLLTMVITLAAVIGNTVNYAIGAWLGKKVYDGTIGWIDQDALKKTHDFFERHGGKTVMIARFLPVIRTFAPLVAGASGMDFRRFQVFNVLGALTWVVSLVYGGFLFGNVPIVRDNLGDHPDRWHCCRGGTAAARCVDALAAQAVDHLSREVPPRGRSRPFLRRVGRSGSRLHGHVFRNGGISSRS